MTATEKISKEGILHFLFTEEGFIVDDRGEVLAGEMEKWRERFEKDRFHALYQLGFREKPKGFDAAGQFLYQVAERFFQTLTDQPDIELTREKAELEPDEDALEVLQNCVPFTVGSEHVTEKWIKNVFRKLNGIFASDIR